VAANTSSSVRDLRNVGQDIRKDPFLRHAGFAPCNQARSLHILGEPRNYTKIND